MLTFEDETVQSETPRMNGAASRLSPEVLGPATMTRAEAENSDEHDTADRNRRISVEDKRIINCKADVNQLVPFKYKWAWEKYLSACANHWMPQEINMSRDIALWRDPMGLQRMSAAWSNVIWAFLSPLTRWRPIISCSAPTAISPIRNAGSICCVRHSKRRFIRMLISISSSRLDWTKERFSTPIMKWRQSGKKDEFLIPFIDTLTDPAFKTGTPEADQKLLRSLIVFACIMEGMFFYVGFIQILALGRQNKMMGAAEQYQYILRDESMHCNFGIDVVNQIKMENPHLWTKAFRDEISALMQKAVELEYRYAEDTLPRGVLGLNAPMFKEYLRYIANRRCQQIGLDILYPGATNPFPWMSEMVDLKKEKNFFETRVTEYQTGGVLSWD